MTISLIAKNYLFDKTNIVVTPGAQVTINFNNADAGIPHNFALYTNNSATTPIFVGGVISGPAQTVYTFTALSAPGTYYFRCDVHPTSMTGSFIVTGSQSPASTTTTTTSPVPGPY